MLLKNLIDIHARNLLAFFVEILSHPLQIFHPNFLQWQDLKLNGIFDQGTFCSTF
jgi:hypothetical protein